MKCSLDVSATDLVAEFLTSDSDLIISSSIVLQNKSNSFLGIDAIEGFPIVITFKFNDFLLFTKHLFQNTLVMICQFDELISSL